MVRAFKSAFLFSVAASLITLADPASAAATITIVNSSCLLVTGCKFNGNIQGVGTAHETQSAYNFVKDPDIVLNYLGSNDDPFGKVVGTTTGSWSVSGFIVNYIAVKSGPAFMLYSVTPGSNGTFTTAGLQKGNNRDLPELSHLAFFGTAAAVPEPSSWALMIVGFGLVGGAMRRRAKVQAAFA